MKRQVLAKVTRSLDEARGPDAIYRLTVPEDWLVEAALVELELPRNLTCAACDGGGCEVCGLAGAVSTRGRAEPPELVQLTLPQREAGSQATCVVRLPGYGGLPLADTSEPRGHLLLHLSPGAAAATLVRLQPPVALESTAAPLAKSLRPLAAAVVLLLLVVLAWWGLAAR